MAFLTGLLAGFFLGVCSIIGSIYYRVKEGKLELISYGGKDG